jgi:hypothetical protein
VLPVDEGDDVLLRDVGDAPSKRLESVVGFSWAKSLLGFPEIRRKAPRCLFRGAKVAKPGAYERILVLH